MGITSKILRLTAKWLFILCLPLLLLSVSIAGAINSLALYEYGFEKYNVSQTTGLDQAQLEAAARGLINYFNSGEEYINLIAVKDGQKFALFNEREMLHLKDVKDLFWLDYWILLGSLGYALAYAGFSIWRKDWRQLTHGLFWGSGLTLALMLLLGLGMLLDFDRLFLQLHLLSFTNDLWLLDPSKDYLIMLFPRGFWYDVIVFIAAATAFGAAVLGGVGFMLYSSSSAAGRRRG
jgi:integral membrane protein (TIGR01906 family)